MTARGDVFEQVQEFPNGTAEMRFNALVGLDDVKERLVKEARLLIDPAALETWSKSHHSKQVIAAVSSLRDRNPLFVFAGDVGCGKTALAETIGDAIARAADKDVLLFPLSLRARGTGSVGEMTQLISSAFDQVKEEIPAPRPGKRAGSAGILLIDEADALAQSRALAQMHHEDRAGVNALIRGIGSITTDGHPIITVMCTNRLNALDPAVQRRAADIVTFGRPSLEQREALLSRSFSDVGFTQAQIHQLAEMTGAVAGRDYGFTFSDLATRLVPATVLDAYPDQPLRFKRVAEIAKAMLPSAPFSAEGG